MRFKKISAAFIGIFWLLCPLAAQQPTISQPWGSDWDMTSDYGPRALPGWDFHEGIDYDAAYQDADLGISIPAVEGGVVVGVARRESFYAVEVKGETTGDVWLYGHLFRNTALTVPEKNSSRVWELKLDAKLVDPEDSSDVETAKVIILWDDSTKTKAHKIYSTEKYSKRYLRVDGNVYVSSIAVNSTAATTAVVKRGDLLGPMGDSDTAYKNVHLHLGLNYNLDLKRETKDFDNPFLYLARPSDNGLSAVIVLPVDGHLFRPAELSTLYPIKVRVDSTAGLDMDKLNLVVVDSYGTRHLVGHWSQPVFSYGGRSDRENYGGVLNSTTVASCGSGPACVTPLDANPATAENNPGLDEFTYQYPFGSLYLPDGEYRLEAVATDVNKNQYTSSPRTFRIDTTQPIFHLSSISPLYDNFRGTTTLTPSTLERAHTLDFEDAVAGISALVITGPEEFSGYSHIFDPPVSTTTLSFTAMPLGPYEIRAVDAVGNESIAPFRIADLDVVVSTGDSQFYGLSVSSVPYGDIKFGCRLAIKTESSLPIERLDIYQFADGENSRNLVKSIQGSDIPPVTYFDTGINTSVFFSTANYLFQVWDKGGSGRIKVIKANYHWEQFPSTVGVYNNAYGEDGWVTMRPGAGEGAFTSAALDLQARPALMSGSVFNLGSGWPYFINKNAEIISGVAAALDKAYNLPLTDSQDFGTVEAHLLTSENADMSGAADVLIAQTRHFATPDSESYLNNGSTCGASGYGYSVCYTETAFPEIALPLKRYSQVKLLLNVPAPSGILYGNCISGDASMCSEGYAASIHATFSAAHSGAVIEPEYFYLYDGKEILPGENVSVPLGSGVSVTFDSVDSRGGYVGLTVQSGDTLPGFTAIPDGHSYNLTSGLTFGGVTLSFPFSPTGLTSAQQGQLKVVRVVDQAKGIYEELPSTVDPANNRVAARAASFGKFMVVAPAYATPHPVSAGNAAGGAELEFVSNAVVSAEGIAATSIFSDVMLKNLKSNDLVPVGNVYYIGPDNTQLYPAGAIKMRYDPIKLAALGIPESDIGLYEFTADSSLMFKLPRQSVRAEMSEITAAVPALYSLFAVLAKSHEPDPADIMLPETLLAFDGNVYFPESGEVYISTTTKILFNPSDWEDAYSTGLLASYYFRDRHPDFVCLKTGRDILKPAGTCENPVYNSAFTLAEGTHTIYYQSVDHAMNFELIKSTEVYVDGNPPVVELFVGTVSVASGGSAYAAVTDSITLSYFDPEVNLVASGVKAVYRFVDVTPDECLAGDPPAACAAVSSTEPFTLASGAHIIYYTAIDQVGNIAGVKSVSLTVGEQLKPPLGYNFDRKYGPPTATTLYYLDLDKAGNSYVGSLRAVYKFNAQRELIGTFGSYGSGAGQFSYVQGIAVSPDGNIYVADSNNKNVQIFSADGNYISAITGFSEPTAVEFDKAGNLYVADCGTNKIVKLSSAGVVLSRISATAIRGLAITENSEIYAANFNNNLVYKFNAAGVQLFQISSGGGRALNRPYGLALDYFGNLYVSDMFNSRVAVFTSDGGYLGNFGTQTTNPDGVLTRPTDVWVSKATGQVQVVDALAGKVMVYDPETEAPQEPVLLSPPDGARLATPGEILVVGKTETGRLVNIYDSGLLAATTVANDLAGFFKAYIPAYSNTHAVSAETKNVFGFGSERTIENRFSVEQLFSPSFSSPKLTSVNVPNFGILYGTTTVVGDYNKDGNQDILVPGMHHYVVLLGKGDGSFNELPSVDIGDYVLITKAAASDLNGDGNTDFVFASAGALITGLGNGDGTFRAPVTLYTYSSDIATDMYVVDFNNDDKLDVLIAFGYKLESFRGNGDGTFSFANMLTAPAHMSSYGLGIGDFNKDGFQDVAFVDGVYFGDGSGRFGNYKQLCASTDLTCGRIFSGDFNQDRIDDILLSKRVSDTQPSLGVLFSDGKGNFSEPVMQYVPFLYTGLPTIDDFNGDTIPDIAVGDHRGVIRIVPGHGDGTFDSTHQLWVGNNCSYIETLSAGDFDGDGLNDIAAALNWDTSCMAADLAVFTNKTPLPDLTPPATAALSLKNGDSGEVAVSWLAPGDDGARGRATSYDLRYAQGPIADNNAFLSAQQAQNISAPQISGSSEVFVTSNVSGGATYYFALKTYDEVGNASGLSNSPGIFTKYLIKTTNTIDGNPEIGMVSSIQPYITEISSASEAWAVAIGSAGAQSLTIASRMYEIGPEGIYNPPALLTLYYSTSSVAAAGLYEEDIAIYEHFAGIGWKKLEGQVIDILNHKITVPVTNIASLFGIFGIVRDRAAPGTNFFVAGSSWPMADGGLYLGAASSITLAASDPVVFGTATGVAYTEFRIDSSSSAPFARYQSSLNLSTGPHRVEFRSLDNAGNTEDIKSIEVFMDTEAPNLGYGIAGSSFAGAGVVYAALGSTVTLVASDAAAGVRSLFYGLNSATHTAASGSAEIFLHSGGTYAISFFAEDNVSNITSTAAVSLFVDTSAPVSALLLDNTPARDGWYTSALAAALGAADEGSGIHETLFSLDGSSFAVYAVSFPVVAEGRHTIGFYSSDNVLNTETVRTAAFGIDTSTPIISYVLAPVPNTAGWNNSAVNVVFTGTDTVSGVGYCSSSFTISGEGLNIPASGYCSDYAGWSSTTAFTISIDTTMPVSSADIAGASGLNGWFVSPALVALAATDNLSGLAGLNYSIGGSSFVTYGSSVAVASAGWHVLRYYAQDKAGNLEAQKRAEFKLDLTAPSVTALAEPQPNDYGWNNTPVRFVFSGTDTVSGLASCEQEKIIALEGSSRTVTGYCMDYAGWSSTAALTVSIDTTAPVISYSSLPVPNAVGWNNSDVSLKFACEDNLSGVMMCPADILLDGEGVNISTAVKAYDYAGNFAQAAVSGIKIDRLPPVSTVSLSGLQRNSWYASTVEVVLASTDALSGVKQIFYSLDDGDFLAYAGGLDVSGEGSHTLKYYAADNADNAEAVKTISFKIDTSAPVVAYHQAPSANAAGWNNSSVAIVFSGTDTFSGVEGCSSGTITLEGAAHSVTGWCRDLAGNIGYATATLNIDMTPAGISIATPQSGQTFIATRGQINIGFAIADNLDPTPGVEAFLVQLEDKGSPRGQRPAKIAVAAGQAIEPLDIDDGMWQLMVSATDFALNTSSAASGAFEVIHDVLAPRSEFAVSGALHGSSDGMFVTSAAQFALTSIDDLVSPEDGIGLGVKEQSVGLKSGGLTLKELTFLAPAPQPGVVFVSTFSLGSLGSLPDGSYDVSYAARDVIGNAAVFFERRYLLDNTAPLTQHNVAGTAHIADGKVYLNSTAALSLTAVDISSGGVAAGLLLTKYRLDGGNWLIYSSSFAISAAGAHTLEYYSLDNVQNAESIRTLNVVVDNTAPATAINVGDPQFNVFELWIITPETPVTLTAADAGAAGLAAGVKGIYYELIHDGGSSSGVYNYTEPFKVGAQGTYTVHYWSVDNAGNTETPKELRLMVSSLQSDALDAVEGLAMTGSADIAGTVKSNKIVSLGGNARILGDVSASTITVTGNAQITGQRFAGAATLAPAPLFMPAIVEIASNTNNNSLIPAKYLSGGKLVVSAKDEITLSTGIYYLTGIELKGGASVVLNGKVDILVAGDVAISGGSSFNAAGTASRLNIFLSTASSLNFSGGANLAAYVYAPYAELKLAGNTLLGGHYFVRSAAISGNGNIMQAGESLPAAAPASGGSKKVSSLASGGSYSVLAGPDPEFKLGEVYVYPNPAKNGQVPTIHLECGIADSVNIKIYTVSGREAHEYTITSAPAVLDDGNGLSYAYEYAWNGRIPSGVYYYFLEAEKAGRKIKKTGKFAVVR